MPNTPDPSTDRDTLREITTAAATIFTDKPRRTAAITYLRQRGIDATALPDRWPLGYAPPGWTRLVDKLSYQFPDQALLDAELARRCSRGTLIDTFRDRIIFPIHHTDGQVAGFIGRDLSGGPAAPKYLNTRQTPLFGKGTLLYGLHEARIATPHAIRPVLVEGPLDVLALATRARLGGDTDLLPLAACGTALTPTQAKLIAEAAAKYDVPVIVAMDGDTAGRTAALAAGEQLRRWGIDVTVSVLPNGTDPAGYLANPDNDLGVFRQSGCAAAARRRGPTPHRRARRPDAVD